MPALTTLTAEQFFRMILKSQVLDREHLKAALREMPPEQTREPLLVSEYLIRTGRLSRFQARKLLRGQSRGLVLGPYQILAPIGRGGMGAVFLAQDARQTELAALKILLPKLAREHERLLARFRREMDLSRQIEHPHIARTYEVGHLEKVYYLAMEFVPGMNLARFVNQTGPLGVPRTARLASEVCLALEHLHGRGLIHRDVKPSNIMVTPNDHAKLLDLGLALQQGEDDGEANVIGGEGYIVGTMDYIAPEQTFHPTRVDGRADLYGLGCTLYFALSGEPPFTGETSREKIQRHRSEWALPLHAKCPSVPEGFSAIIGRLMAKSPDQRFASPAELAQALQPWADQAIGPLERPDDPAYTEAVQALRSAERATEYLLPDLPSASLAEPVFDWTWAEPPAPGTPAPDHESTMRWVVTLAVAAAVLGLAAFGLLVWWLV